MIWVSPKGKLSAYGAACSQRPEYSEEFEELLLGRPGQRVIPAVFTRQEAVLPGFCRVGWSSWRRDQNGRIRAAAVIPEACAEKAYTPWEVMGMEERYPAAIRPLLSKLKDAAGTWEVDLGLIGAAAMETVTGMPYLHEGSDIDLVVTAGTFAAAQRFERELEIIEKQFGILVDAEIQISKGGVKLKELCSVQDTVLVKGEREIFLLSKKQVCASMETDGKKVHPHFK